MKKTAGVILLCLLSGAAVGADVLQELRISKGEAARDILMSLTRGRVNYSRVRDAFKAATPAARAALVEQTLVWTKAYVNSPQFGTEYAAYRAKMMPRSPERKLSVDQELAARRAKRQADYENARNEAAKLPPDVRKAVEEGLRASEAAQKQAESAEFRNMERQGLEQQRQREDEQQAAKVARWQQDYPEDVRLLVKSRLQQFLRETADVNYAAKLNGTRFAEPTYEAKPGEWKLAYRAGKETTERARAFAQAWLAELK